MANIGIDARIWRAQTGGLGRYARNLVRELVDLDRENQYTVVIAKEDEPEFDVTAPNFRPLVVDIPHYSYAEQLDLPKVLNKERFDLIHFTHFNHPLFYRRPFVVTVHDLILHLFPSGKQTKSPIRKYAYRWLMNDTKRADRILVPSLATKQDLITMLGFPGDKIVVTAEGSENKFRIHSEAEIKAVKKKFGLPDKYLIFVSRWEHYKGLPAVIEAYKQVKREIPELGLVICGRPVDQSPDVAEMVRSNQAADPHVITPGFVSDDDLAALYSGASAYVHPSWYEGFGIMILEAFAAGAPVVTSNVSSLPEVVGDAGLLVDPHDHNDIAEKIRQILTDPQLAKTLRQKGLARAKDFSWKKMAEETLAVYESVLRSRI